MHEQITKLADELGRLTKSADEDPKNIAIIIATARISEEIDRAVEIEVLLTATIERRQREAS